MNAKRKKEICERAGCDYCGVKKNVSFFEQSSVVVCTNPKCIEKNRVAWEEHWARMAAQDAFDHPYFESLGEDHGLN